MQNTMVSAGVTQFSGMNPKALINIGGLDWKLRKDATDSSMSFPHNRVNWINAGCESLGENKAYFCWIMGIIPPNQGTLEKPISVMYVGFHPQRIAITPNMVTQIDLDRMHVYVSDASGFALNFANVFLGLDEVKPVTREAISPWPETTNNRTIEDADSNTITGE